MQDEIRSALKSPFPTRDWTRIVKCRTIAISTSNPADGRLFAGITHRKEVGERLKVIFKKVEEAKRKMILLIDEIHLVLGAGLDGGCQVWMLLTS